MDEVNGAVEEREKKEEEQDEPDNNKIPNMEINPDPRCPEGYVWIKPAKNFYGRYVKGYCRKSKGRFRF
jgi:hypothetical protein